jgi:tripartite-type tricarboxylate transporter receptor subunit TctC
MKFHQDRARNAALAGMLAGALATPAVAQAQANVDAYPARPVTIVIALAAGGPADVETRLYTAKLAPLLGQSFVIDFKPGGGGSIGVGQVAKAAADGYTLLHVDGNFPSYKPLYKDLPFDTERDFAPVTLMSLKHFVMVVPATSKLNTMGDYISYAKANPGKLNFSTTGAGGSTHLAGAALHNMTATQVTFVHYKGSSQVLPDLMSGRLDVVPLALQPALPLLKSGKVRALGIMGQQRSPLIPGVATISEQGIKGYTFESWIGFAAPAATPAGIVNKLNEAFVKVVRMPDIVAALEAQGSVPVGNSPAQYRQMLLAEIERRVKVVRDSNIQLEN